MEESGEECLDPAEKNNYLDTDEELILEGSELYNYLKSLQNEGLEVYHNKTEHTQSKETSTCYPSQTLYTLVPKEILEFTNKILHSNLLLDEDAAYLFNISSDLVADKTHFMHSKKWACGVLLLDVISTYFYINLNTLQGPLLTLITSSSLLLAYMSKILYTNRSYNNKLNHVLNVLQQSFFLIKKIIQVIAEDDSLLASKEKLQWLKRSDHSVQEELGFKRKMTEISNMSSKITSALKNLIAVSKNTTFSLMPFNKEYSYRKEDYIAFYCDEKLCNDETINSTNRPYNLAELNKLKNIYLLMQSECLRLLGLCFCQCKSYYEIYNLFKVVSIYSKESSYILCKLQNDYKRYFYSAFDQKVNSIPRAKALERTALIHNISRSLNGLLIEVRELEDYVEGNENSQEKDEKVLTCLNKMEKEFLEVLDLYKYAKDIYLKQTGNNKSIPSLEESNSAQIDSNVTKTNITVGYSDFSINGPDQVFLGSSDGAQNSCNEIVEDFNEFKPPNTLIKELKVALVNKRMEFEQREIRALKSSDDIDAYKSCSLDSQMLPIQKTLGSDGSQSENKSVSKNTKVFPTDNHENPLHHHGGQNTSLTNFEPIEKSEEFIRDNDRRTEISTESESFQKNIAIAASNRSIQWNKMNTVDYFEDEFSD